MGGIKLELQIKPDQQKNQINSAGSDDFAGHTGTGRLLRLKG